MSEKILLVDDDPDILEFLGYNLKQAGYSVLSSEDGKTAINIAKKEIPNIIILDVMMPGMDGVETCLELKKIALLSNTIVVFLTARNEDYSQIAGLDAGADDYIAKPIKPRLLIAKIKSLLRRANNDESNAVNLVGEISINKDKYIVEKSGVKINLPKKEFELLSMLMSQPDYVFTRDFILNSVWGDEVVVGDRTIDVHIRKLREKLGDNYIRTIKGVGYKFVTE